MSILEKPVCELAYYQNIIDDLKKKGNVPVALLTSRSHILSIKSQKNLIRSS